MGIIPRSSQELASGSNELGVMITFSQFVFVALEGLPWHFTLSPRQFFLRKRQIPFLRWALIVTLFFITSTLNNAALGYHVSIPVYIIFRSGGTLVTMSMGWLFVGKHYTTRQIASVALLTIGVIISTWSNAHNQVDTPLTLRSFGCLDDGY
jgi:solute carrier family 35 (UDP-xylose/UDP-N-acetylglucosamine transporter), member B4